MTISKEAVAKALGANKIPLTTVLKFLKYHEENPDVWKWFERFALEAASSGKYLGSKAVMERVRWEVEVVSNSEFKVNNSYTAYYARVFATKHPQYKDYFETREIKGLAA